MTIWTAVRWGSVLFATHGAANSLYGQAHLQTNVVASSKSRHVLSAQSERHEDFQTADVVSAIWSGGRLMGVQYNRTDEPIIWTITKSGERERIRFSIPEGRFITVYGLAGSDDGGIALIGSAYSEDGRGAAFLARISADRKETLVTNFPQQSFGVVTIASDNVIWTIGCVWNEGRTVKCNVLKRFDPLLRLIDTSFLRVHGEEYGPGGAGNVANLSILRASKDRVGWLATTNEYIEFSLDGLISLRVPGPPERRHNLARISFGLSGDNQVLVGTDGGEQQSSIDLWTLERDSRSWTAVNPGDFRLARSVLGFDGSMAVTTGFANQKRSIVHHRLTVSSR